MINYGIWERLKTEINLAGVGNTILIKNITPDLRKGNKSIYVYIFNLRKLKYIEKIKGQGKYKVLKLIDITSTDVRKSIEENEDLGL